MQLKVKINDTELNSFKVIQHLKDVYGDDNEAAKTSSIENKHISASTAIQDRNSEHEMINTFTGNN